MIKFLTDELDVLSGVIDEEIDNTNHYLREYKDDEEVKQIYKILLKIQSKIEKEQSDVWRSV